MPIDIPIVMGDWVYPTPIIAKTTEPSFKASALRDIRDIKRSLTIDQFSEGTCVVVVAISKTFGENKLIEIPSRMGRPISNEVHDFVRDVFHVEGVDHHDLGNIPVNYVASCGETCWSIDVPLPETVIRRYLTAGQKSSFNKWKSRYKSEFYKLRYIQFSL